jgi:hypothetical protein
MNGEVHNKVKFLGKEITWGLSLMRIWEQTEFTFMESQKITQVISISFLYL